MHTVWPDSYEQFLDLFQPSGLGNLCGHERSPTSSSKTIVDFITLAFLVSFPMLILELTSTVLDKSVKKLSDLLLFCPPLPGFLFKLILPFLTFLTLDTKVMEQLSRMGNRLFAFWPQSLKLRFVYWELLLKPRLDRQLLLSWSNERGNNCLKSVMSDINAIKLFNKGFLKSNCKGLGKLCKRNYLSLVYDQNKLFFPLSCLSPMIICFICTLTGYTKVLNNYNAFISYMFVKMILHFYFIILFLKNLVHKFISASWSTMWIFLLISCLLLSNISQIVTAFERFQGQSEF